MSVDGRIRKTQGAHNRIISRLQREENPANWDDMVKPDSTLLSETSQPARGESCLVSLTCGTKKKSKTQRHRSSRRLLGTSGGVEVGRDWSKRTDFQLKGANTQHDDTSE